MSTRVFHLSGRVTRSDNAQGVHGLYVEVWSGDSKTDQPLGVGITNRDGSYHIDLPGDADCCDCPDAYIVVRDRDCRLLYDGCGDRRCCEPGKPVVSENSVEGIG